VFLLMHWSWVTLKYNLAIVIFMRL
jgi:hypothetical protein